MDYKCSLYALRKRFGTRWAVLCPNREKRAYSSVGAGTEVVHSDLKITNRWKMAVFKSCKKHGMQQDMPPFDHNLQKTCVSSGWGRPARRTTMSRKLQIVGKWPFLNHMRKAGRDGIYPLLTTTYRKRAYLPVVARRVRTERPTCPATDFRASMVYGPIELAVSPSRAIRREC